MEQLPNTPPVERSKLQELLNAGLSQRQIEKELGISRRQIRKHIESNSTAAATTNAHIKHSTTKLAHARDQIMKLSVRPEGVKRSELYNILRDAYGEQVNHDTNQRELKMTQSQYQYLTGTVKKQASREGVKALFVPEWMPISHAIQANELMVCLAGELHEVAQDKMQEFLAPYPETSATLAFKELIALAFPPPGKEPVELRCARNHDAAGELDRRTQPMQPRLSPSATSAQTMRDKELEEICY